MWQQFLASFTAGLALGPACILHCGVYHAAFLTRHADTTRRRNAILGVMLIVGRLSAYLLFGLMLGLLTTTGVLVIQPWALTLALALVMAVYALKPRRATASCRCAKHPRLVAGSGFLLGFMTGLSPCPPFLASRLIALRVHGVSGAVLTLLAFFAGSSIYMVPVWFGVLALPKRFSVRLGTVSRVFAACVAVYACVSLVGIWRRGRPATIDARDRLPGGALLAQVPEPAPPGPPTFEAKSGVTIPPPAADDVEPLFVKEPPTRTFTEALLRRLDMSLKEALFYTPLGDGEVQCNLCPSQCILAEGEQGLCRARVNIDGKLRSIVYERPVSIHIDPIEKKPLYHVLPESQAMSLATVGCNLGCVFCQNFEISQAAPEEIRRHWNAEYPEIATATEKIAILERAGYDLTGYFVLPATSWIDNYYEPTEGRIPAFLERHGALPEATSVVEMERQEAGGEQHGQGPATDKPAPDGQRRQGIATKEQDHRGIPGRRWVEELLGHGAQRSPSG